MNILEPKTSIRGKMNIDFSETYDLEDDTYYVTFKTGEPSYSVEMDDILLLEVGVFSNLPTGFRILNFKKHNVKAVKIKVLIKLIRKTLSKAPAMMHEREEAVERALEKVLVS